MAMAQVVAPANTYISIPVAHRRRGQNPPLVPITRNGAPVRVGDLLSGHANRERGLVDHEDDSFDNRAQEKIGYVVAWDGFRSRIRQRRHMISRSGQRPNNRRNVAINAVKCLLDVLEKQGDVRVTVQGLPIIIGSGLSPRDLLLEGLRPEGRSYALQLAVPTTVLAELLSAPNVPLGAQGAHNPDVPFGQELPPIAVPLSNSITTTVAAFPSGSASGTSPLGRGPMRSSTTRTQVHPYAPTPRRAIIGGRTIMRGVSGFGVSSLPLRSVMGDPQSPLFMDPSLSYSQSSFSNAIAGPSTMSLSTRSSPSSQPSGPEAHRRYSPGVCYPSVVANAGDELGLQEPAFAVPSLSTSPEPMESLHWDHFFDSSVASSPQSTLFSDVYQTPSPVSSSSLEPNYAYSPVSDPIYPPGSAATIPRSMTYPTYRGHSADDFSYWNMDSNYGFQG